MQKITPFLWFNDNAEAAMNFYVSVFKNAKILSLSRLGDNGPESTAAVITARFELEGQEFMVLNGGPHYQFTPAISLFVDCVTQEEVDELWGKLTADGGREERCGWLTDKFGLSWQIIPKVLGELMGDSNPEKSTRVMNAMMQMVKIDVAALQRAYDGD